MYEHYLRLRGRSKAHPRPTPHTCRTCDERMSSERCTSPDGDYLVWYCANMECGARDPHLAGEA